MADTAMHFILLPAADNRCPVCRRPMAAPEPEPSAATETTRQQANEERERLRLLLGEARLLADAFYLFQGNPDPDNIARLFEAAEAVAFVSRQLEAEAETGSFA